MEILDDAILEGLDIGFIVSIAVGGGVSPRVIGFLVGAFAGKLGFTRAISVGSEESKGFSVGLLLRLRVGALVWVGLRLGLGGGVRVRRVASLEGMGD